MMKTIISYDQITDAVNHVADRLGGCGVDMVVGIVRGGMVPGYLVAEHLNVPFTTITWQTRDGATKEINSNLIGFIEQGKTVAFVDDINDSGRTLNDIIEHYSKFATPGQLITAALYAKEGSAHTTTIKPVTVFNQSEWIVFPWEWIN